MSERLAAPDGAPNALHERLYERWSRGGAGLLVTGNVFVGRDAIGESGNVYVGDAPDTGAFAAWARAAQVGGNHAWVQINHAGRQSPRWLTGRPVAPSAVGLRGTYGAFATPRALEDREVSEIVERYARTAAVVKEAGWSGVQVHGAHGYLISQFLSPLTNQRDDRWGGDAKRRRRFLLEIVRAVRAAVGRDYPVSVKLNSADFQRGGFTEDESMAVVEALDAEGIDLLEISGGTYESAVMFAEVPPKHESTRQREAFFLEYAERVRSRTRAPVMVTGGFRTAGGMGAAIESGAVDVIGLARPLVVEPDLPARLVDGSADAAVAMALATGLKQLDAVIQGGFYQAQILRLALGLEPDVKGNRWAAVYAYLRGPKAPPRAKVESESTSSRSSLPTM
jgi:2,4-dienoyl-CoA reductase-like NADH-dependent reductase (Old Yellow Enzyme family)